MQCAKLGDYYPSTDHLQGLIGLQPYGQMWDTKWHDRRAGNWRVPNLPPTAVAKDYQQSCYASRDATSVDDDIISPTSWMIGVGYPSQVNIPQV